ncbi:MAG: DUF4395 domain-containing protein [Mycobacteriaceae bacterium]|uniref:DUF4395 domain-containing protein n=1 Tax=Corynebacterium sp. TaxID=1720 RepID=UPI003F9CA327
MSSDYLTPYLTPLSEREAQASPPRGAATLWWFPPVVNDRAARTTAMLVVALSVLTLVFSWTGFKGVAVVLNVLLFGGFVLRVLAGPRFDPFGQLSVRWLAGRVFGDPVMTAGPPKRFAQGIGVAFSGVSLVLRASGLGVAADVVLVLLVVAASLEGFAGICLGCRIFSWLQRVGVVSQDVRADCVVR